MKRFILFFCVLSLSLIASMAQFPEGKTKSLADRMHDSILNSHKVLIIESGTNSSYGQKYNDSIRVLIDKFISVH